MEVIVGVCVLVALFIGQCVLWMAIQHEARKKACQQDQDSVYQRMKDGLHE